MAWIGHYQAGSCGGKPLPAKMPATTLREILCWDQALLRSRCYRGDPWNSDAPVSFSLSRLKYICLVLGFVTMCVPSASAQSQSPARASSPGANEFNIDLTLYFWLPAIDGEIGLSGQTFELGAEDSSVPGDFFGADKLYGAFGLAGLHYGRFHGFVNASWANIEYGRTVPLLGETTMRVEETVFDFTAGYDVINEPSFMLVPFAGARYARVETHVSADALGDLPNEAVDQLFPVIGIAGRYALSQDWWLAGSADVGAVSGDHTWGAYAVVGYKVDLFGAPASLVLGYRILKLDVTEGGFSGDVIEHGLLFGLNFRAL